MRMDPRTEKLQVSTQHPEYDNTFNYDIMILGLNEMLTFNGKVSALCLPEAPYDHPGIGRTIIVQGWGYKIN